MQRHHLLNLLFAALLILPDTYAAPQARSFLSWLLGADEAKTEETFIDGYRPLFIVRNYNGLKIQPHNGDPTVFLNSPTSLHSELPLPGSDQHFIDLLYITAPFLPEHEFEYGPYLQPYLQSVSVESIDRFRNILELDGEAKIGLPAKTKLVRFLQFVKEQKMKPLRAAFQKKNDLILTAPHGTPSAPPPPPPQPAPAQVYFYPPPPPQSAPAQVYFYPPPPNPSQTIIVPARPTGFVAPPQPPPSPVVFVPPTFVHSLPPTQFLQPEFSAIPRSPYFEHPVAQEIHENVFDAEKKGGPWADQKVTVGATESVDQKQMNEENSTSTFSNEVETDEEVVQKRSHKENYSVSSANSTAPIDIERVEKNGSTSSNTSTVVQTQTSTSLTSTTIIIPEATELNGRSKRDHDDSSKWTPWLWHIDPPFSWGKREEPKDKSKQLKNESEPKVVTQYDLPRPNPNSTPHPTAHPVRPSTPPTTRYHSIWRHKILPKDLVYYKLPEIAREFGQSPYQIHF